MYTSEFKRAAQSVYEYIQSMRLVGKILKVSSSTVHRWLNGHKNRGWPSRGSKFTDAMVALIELQLKTFPATTAAQLKALILEQLGVNVSRQLVALVLRSKLNMSWKRTRKRGCASARHDRQEQMRNFRIDFERAFTDGNLAAIDESGFDQRARPIYGYAPRSKPAILVIPASKIKHVHYSLILAAHMNGKSHSTLHDSSVTGNRFAEFVARLPFTPGTTLLLDNASIHKCSATRKVAADKGFKLLFTPPYTPEFNPVEMMFGTIKNKFYKDRYASTFKGADMSDCVDVCVDVGTYPSSVSRCFSHVSEGLKTLPDVGVTSIHNVPSP